MTKNKKGFTLIELLVVIAIIGLLATIAVVALGNSRSRARDARRLADIKQIQTALQVYYHEQGGYPPTGSIATSIASGTSVYMAITPTAPMPNETGCTVEQNTYTYASPSSDTYTITYCLGNKTGDIPAGVGTATPAGLRN